MVGQVLPYTWVVDQGFDTYCLELFFVSDARVQKDVRCSNYATGNNHFLFGYDLLALTPSLRANFDHSKLIGIRSDGHHSSHLGIEEYVYVFACMTQKCSYPTTALGI